MRKYMKKQFVQTEIHVAEVVEENGSLTVKALEPIKHLGSASKVRAQQIAERIYGKGVKVTDIKKEVENRKMLSSMFYELSDPDDGNEPDADEEDEDEENDAFQPSEPQTLY